MHKFRLLYYYSKFAFSLLLFSFTAKLLKHWATMTNVSFACLTIVFDKKNSSAADVKVRMDKMKETK